MFGLFSGHKKFAVQAADQVEMLLRNHFMFTENWPNPQSRFVPPVGFWKNPYILAFSITTAAFMRDELFDGKRWSDLKRAEYFNVFLARLDYLNRDGLATNFAAIGQEAAHTPEFAQGRTDAATNFGATMRLLRQDDTDPVVLEARKLGVSFEKMYPDPYDAFLAAIYELTIRKHLAKSFPK